MSRLLQVLALGLWVAACTQEARPSESAAAKVLSAAVEAADAAPTDVCAEVEPEGHSADWVAGPVESTGTPVATTFAASAGEWGLLALQHGDGLGQGAAGTAEVLLDGQRVAFAGSGEGLKAVPVWLSASNQLEVRATGGSSARASVAHLSKLPCTLLDVTVERGRGAPARVSRSFHGAGPGAQGVLVVEARNGNSLVGQVVLNERVVMRLSPEAGPFRPRVIQVPLLMANTLKVELSGGQGSSIQARVLDVDTLAPMFELTSPQDGTLATATPWEVSGTAGLDVTRVEVNGVPATLTSGTWSASVPLTPGQNALVTTARDACGNVRRSCRAVTLDDQKPVVTVSGVSEGQYVRGPVVLTYTVEDAHLDTATATLDGLPFSSGGSVSGDGPHVLVVTAVDRAGNTEVVQRSFVIDSVPPELVVQSPVAGLVTQEEQVELVASVVEANVVASVKVGGQDLVRGGDGLWRRTMALTEGANHLVVSAMDAAGNADTATLTVLRDSTPPQLVVTSPSAGARIGGLSVKVRGTATDTSPVVLTLNGAPIQVTADGSFEIDHALSQGDNTLELLVTDAINLSAARTIHVRANGRAPNLTVTEPTSDTQTEERTVTVRGTASVEDTEDSVTVVVAGSLAAVSGDGAFVRTVQLTPGHQTLRVVAMDGYGLQTERIINVTRVVSEPDGGSTDAGTLPDAGSGTDAGSEPQVDSGTPGTDAGTGSSAPVLRVDMPSPDAVLGGESLAVVGQVEGGTLPLDVKINGVAATMMVRSFSQSLSLPEGDHTLTLVVTDADERTASTTRTVTVDRTAPMLEVTRPAASPVTVSESPYLIQGIAGDKHLAGVTVQGVPVTVMGGSFSAAVPLSMGQTVVNVVASDRAGNQKHRNVVLNVENAPPVITVLEPASGSEAPAATVRVRARVVAFAALSEVRIGTGLAAEESPGIYAAHVPLALGENTLTVTATDVRGFSATNSVTVFYRDPATEPLVVTGVQPEPGAVNVKTDALISVSFNKAATLESVRTGFRVLHRGADLPGGYSLAPGGQTATFIARSPLPESEPLEIRVSDLHAAVGPGQADDFRSELTVRRPLTRIRGFVMDDSFQPLPGARVVMEGTGESVRTGADGNWSLSTSVSGPQVLRYEGGTSQDGRPLPTVRRLLTVTAEEETVDVPVALTAVDTDSAVRVDTTAALHVDFSSRHEGLTLDGSADALLFENGQTQGMLTATRLEAVTLPMKLGSHSTPTAVWQIGPAGLRVQKPLMLQFPNVTSKGAGHFAVVLAHEPRNHTLARMGLARVSADGAYVRTETPLDLRSVEVIGYMMLTDEQHTIVNDALANMGGQGASPDDGGMQGTLFPGQLPARPMGPLWKQALDALLSEAHAQYPPGTQVYSQLDQSIQNQVPATVVGALRAPEDRRIAVGLSKDTQRFIAVPRQVALPYRMPVSMQVTRVATGASGARIDAMLSAKAANGSEIAPPAGEVWAASSQAEDQTEVTLTGNVELSRGTTTIFLRGRTGSELRTYILQVETVPVDPEAGTAPDAGAAGDGGTGGAPYRLVFKLDEQATAGTEEMHSVVRFPGMRVTVTGPGPTMSGVTGATGEFAIPVSVPAGASMGIACADVPLGARPVLGRDTATGAPVVQSMVSASYPTCSPTFTVSSGSQVRADLLVDARLLHGALHFVDREGRALRHDCEANASSEYSPDAGAYVSIANADISQTEVHFFRGDDLTRPIAQFTVGVPDNECAPAPQGQRDPQGRYARVRMGPTTPFKRVIRERCRELNPALVYDPSAPAPSHLSEADRAFYETECRDNHTNFLRLTAGEPLVVVAVNHATGHTGMTRLPVPPISKKQLDETGRCALDDELGPLKVVEFGQTVQLSRCSVAQLGIDAPVYLFPPEIDVRIWRSAEAGGIQQDLPPTLVRHGGAATTRDNYVHLDTHWRVRTMAPVEWRSEDGGVRTSPIDAGLPPDRVDGGVSQCGAGSGPDGSANPNCTPNVLRDVGISGVLLETCSEYGPGAAASATKQAACLRSQDLQDVPAGVPPLAGRVVRVTDSAMEQPEVTQFAVVPGRGSGALQAAMRIMGADGQQMTVGSLPRANFYLHVVGHQVFPRDLDGDGVLAPSERNSSPPDFTESEEVDLPGMPSRALGLKNVYSSMDPDGFRVLRYDRDREHEFRVLDLTNPRVVAQNSVGQRDVGSEESTEAALDDLAYRFLAALLEPDEPGRAGTLTGDYVVRFGSDQYGVECDVSFDDGALVGSCDNEFIDDVLAANDILYMELYLSGNAENVLYRFNLMGVSPRIDLLKAGSAFTAERSVEVDAQGQAVTDRPVSTPAVARFALDPGVIHRGRVKVCTSENCAADTLLKQADVELLGSGAYRVVGETGTTQQKLEQLDEVGLNAARFFQVPIPANMVSMPGALTAGRRFYLVQEIELPEPRHLVQRLGRPQGRFEGANARAPGQATIQGINVADGHLAFEHEDFSVPHMAEVVRFARTYNNQSSRVGPTGVGWTHSYEGYVQEEKVGRYTVVLAGQAYDVPLCGAIDEEESTADSCATDRSHGLDVTLVKRDGLNVVVVKTPDGFVYEFGTLARGSSPKMRRRWLLDRFHNGRGREDDEGWTKLVYRAEDTLLDSVERSPGKLRLEFDYEAIDVANPAVAYRLRNLSRNEGFKLLKSVELVLISDEKVLHSLEFGHDERGNLTRVTRVSTSLPTATPGTDSNATQSWEYAYLPLPADMSGYKQWLASNELATAKYFLSPPMGGERKVQWQVTYGRTASQGTYAHLDVREVVTSVHGTGMPSPGWRIVAPDSSTRKIHRPDGVEVTLQLNAYGNTNAVRVPDLGPSTMAWGSDARGGPVQMEVSASPSGRSIRNEHNNRMQLDRKLLEEAPPNSIPIPGVGASAELWSVQSRHEATGRITSMTVLKGGAQQASVSTPLTNAGDPMGVTISDGAFGTAFAASQFPDPDGVVIEGEDPAGNTLLYSGHENQPLGLPTHVTVTHPEHGTETPTGGLLRYTIAYSYDDLGNRVSEHNETTGARVDLAYDSVGRVLTRNVAGQPSQEWSYSYELGDDELTVTESLPLGHWGRTQIRKTITREGLKREETVHYGRDDQPATVRYTGYLGTQLRSFQDERGKLHEFVYDSAGRLTGEKVDSVSLYTYSLDEDGKVVEETDSNGLRTRIGYDALGRAVRWEYESKINDPGCSGDCTFSDVESVVLNASGAVVERTFGSLKDGSVRRPHIVESTVDALGRERRVASHVDSQGGINSRTEYDEAGRVTLQEDYETELRDTYEYADVMGRLTRHERTVQSVHGTRTLLETHAYSDSSSGTTTTVVTRTLNGRDEASDRQEVRTYTVDTLGRVRTMQETVDGQLAIHSWSHDALGRQVKHTDPSTFSRETTWEYDAAGNLLRASAPATGTIEYYHDEQGRVRRRVGPQINAQLEMYYDALGRIERRTQALDPSSPDGALAEWRFEYLGGGVEKEYAPHSTTITRTQNARGLVEEEFWEQKDYEAHTVRTRYDGAWVKRQETAEGQSLLVVSREATNAIDDRGRARNEVEAWSSQGREYRYETSTQWNGRQSTAVNSWTWGTTDLGGRTVTTQFDSLGNAVRRTQGGGTDQWDFYADGKSMWEASFGFDADVAARTWTYETSGRVKGMRFGQELTAYTYYADGLPRSVTTPDLRIRMLAFNARGLLETEKYGRDNDVRSTRYAAHDSAGNATQVWHAADSETERSAWNYGYGPNGELLRVSNADIGTFEYTYDAFGHIADINPPVGSVTPSSAFKYDSLGRERSRSRGTSTWNTTWRNGSTEILNPLGERVERILDGRGRVVRELFKPAAPQADASGVSRTFKDIESVDYAFNGLDQLRQATERRGNNLVVRKLDYDLRDRLWTNSDGESLILYSYHDSGALKSLQSPAGIVQYAVDGYQRLDTVILTNGRALDVDWEAGGERLSSLGDASNKQSYCYDARGRIKSITHSPLPENCASPIASPLLRFSYEYDERDNRLSELVSRQGSETVETTQFGYDAADRLTGVRYPEGQSVVYSLSNDGSRLAEKIVSAYAGPLGKGAFEAVTHPQEHLTYHYDTSDAPGSLREIRKKALNLPPGDVPTDIVVASYSTNRAGRVVRDAQGALTRWMYFDAAGRLVEMDLVDGDRQQKLTYSYDYAGLRRSRSNGDSVTKYLWSGSSLIEEQLPGAEPLMYQRAAGLVVATGGDRILHDGLGSAVGRLKTDGTLTTTQFDAWGGYRKGIAPTAAQASIGYTGHAWDAEAGLTYAQQRWYDSATGRFLSEDPVGAGAYLGAPNELNPWLYTAANPLRYVDPDGRELTWAGAKTSAKEIARQGVNGTLTAYEYAVRAFSLSRLDREGYYLDGNWSLQPKPDAYYKERAFQALENRERVLETLAKGPSRTGAVLAKNSFDGAVDGIGGNITRAAQKCYRAHISQGPDDKGTSECVEALPGAAGGVFGALELATGTRALINSLPSGTPNVPELAPAGVPNGALRAADEAEDLATSSRPMQMSAGNSYPAGGAGPAQSPSTPAPSQSGATQPSLPDFNDAEVDAAIDAAKSWNAYELPGQNPKTKNGLTGMKLKFDLSKDIYFHNNAKFKGIANAPGGKVEVRYHSANPNAPIGKYSNQNPTTQVNSVNPKEYMLPDGRFKPLSAMTEAEKEAAHFK
ncbi:RHS repeat-associated core domain-containing protein [Myxococcus virescens]|uniref:RHS repeat-associated core domain-containing protein n=1 Tax=Myxococcus virescens TaxID=83456 RepID=A0ABY0N6J0_9BACT|nr:RHS repeat-associated core domain-containing protein [Myxococcus virescens]